MLDTHQLIQVLQKTLAYSGNEIHLHEPYFHGNEWKYLKECLDTGWVSSLGKFVNQFERNLMDFTNAKYAVVTVNGTSALHISFILAGIQPNDEILVPSLTFVGTVNAMRYCQATPHFIDSDTETLGIDATLLDDYLQEITEIKNHICTNKITHRPIRALCVMHTLGHPVDLDPIVELCQKYQLLLIEDAAEALGSYYKSQHVGHRGLLGALSFNGNKIITTGGGGAVITDNKALAQKAKHLTTTAKLPHAWRFEHDEIGYNYRLPNINAALGCAQLEKIDEYLHAKRALFGKYQQALLNFPGIKMIKEPHYAKSNYWLNAFFLTNENENRDALLDQLNQANLRVRPLWDLQHRLRMNQNCPRMPLIQAEKIVERVITLPSSPQLISNEISEIMPEATL